MDSAPLVCQYCGSTFGRAHNAGPIPRYCSAAHRQRAHEARRIADSARAQLAALGHSDAIAAAVHSAARLTEIARVADTGAKYAGLLPTFDYTSKFAEMTKLTDFGAKFADSLKVTNLGSSVIPLALSEIGSTYTAALSKVVAGPKLADMVKVTDFGAKFADSIAAAGLGTRIVEMAKLTDFGSRFAEMIRDIDLTEFGDELDDEPASGVSPDDALVPTAALTVAFVALVTALEQGQHALDGAALGLWHTTAFALDGLGLLGENRTFNGLMVFCFLCTVVVALTNLGGKSDGDEN
jgi:hypothetical protein